MTGSIVGKVSFQRYEKQIFQDVLFIEFFSDFEKGMSIDYENNVWLNLYQRSRICYCIFCSRSNWGRHLRHNFNPRWKNQKKSLNFGNNPSNCSHTCITKIRNLLQNSSCSQVPPHILIKKKLDPIVRIPSFFQVFMHWNCCGKKVFDIENQFLT